MDARLRRSSRLVVALAAVALLLSACTVSPPTSPTAAPLPIPSTRALSSLKLTSAGLDELKVGAPVPTSSDLTKFGPNLCAPGPGWISLYPQTTDDSSAQPLDAFDVLTETSSQALPITAVFVWSRKIATPEGIRVGSTEAAVEAAYPLAKLSQSYATRVYAIVGASGTLVIEVASDNRFAQGEWPANELGTVVWMFAIRSGATVKSIAGDNAAGPCPGSTEQPGDID